MYINLKSFYENEKQKVWRLETAIDPDRFLLTEFSRTNGTTRSMQVNFQCFFCKFKTTNFNSSFFYTINPGQEQTKNNGK